MLLISEQELSQLSSTASQVIIAKQNLCLWLTNNIWILSIVCILCGVVLLILGCKMWYSRQKKTDAKQDLDLQTAEAQYKKMTMEEKEIDWEQRRYELAKAAMQGFCSNPHQQIMDADSNMVAEWSIGFADSLIKKLKGE